jgi:hypothetical protein
LSVPSDDELGLLLFTNGNKVRLESNKESIEKFNNDCDDNKNVFDKKTLRQLIETYLNDPSFYGNVSSFLSFWIVFFLNVFD